MKWHRNGSAIPADLDASSGVESGVGLSDSQSQSRPDCFAWRIVSQMSEIDEVDGLSDGTEVEWPEQCLGF